MDELVRWGDSSRLETRIGHAINRDGWLNEDEREARAQAAQDCLQRRPTEGA